MPSLVIVGAQYGDEGKGKVTDYLAENAELVVRHQGGNNAGHTVVVQGKEYKLHLLPSGVVRGKKCLIGAGVVLDPKSLLSEISQFKGEEINLGIDPRVHIIFPYHHYLDSAKEKDRGENCIGTTGRGIGPCYADRATRQGITFGDFVNKEIFREKFKNEFENKKNILEKLYLLKMEKSFEEYFTEYSAIADKLKNYELDVSLEVSNALKENKTVLFEGAQGTFLDLDFGTYPYVTSSHPIAGNLFVGVGIGIQTIERVIGIVKAYTTRVGEGPFTTELEGELADTIKKRGNEFGTTTGRPRRIGWLDLVLLRTAVRINGLTEIALTKIDVLEGLDELQICTHYECKGKKLTEFPANVNLLKDCKPVYKKFKGFGKLSDKKTFEELPSEAKDYISFIEKELSVPIKFISLGPGREDSILK